MDYDYRNRAGAAYDSQLPVYGRPPSTSTPPSSHPHPMYAPPSQHHHPPGLYPRVGQHPINSLPGRNPPSFHHTSSSPSANGIGIRVVIKPEYRITPPPHLSAQIRDIPRSSFQFDFDLERKILAEAEKDNQNWAGLGLENVLPKMPERTSQGSTGDPIANKYISSGLNREAVPLAVANFGDNPTKVKEFADHYTRLRDMGFPSNKVADALLMFDNDTEKALAYLLNNPS
nr:homeobox protein slou-like [Ipomoea batatas]